MSHELYKKYRPRDLKDIVGQPDAVRALRGFAAQRKIPHFMLLSGPSGVGKTTIIRILRDMLGCGERDFKEINGASSRGIDMVREIEFRQGMNPIDGKVRIWCIDECHALSSPAQQALLKILEDTPDVAYFLMATTEPSKLIPTIRNRATHLVLKPVSPMALRKLVDRVLGKEKRELTEDVMDKLIDSAEGSARRVLVTLDRVLQLDDEDQQMKAVLSSDYEREGEGLAKALMNVRVKWPEVAKIIKAMAVGDDELEKVRYRVLGYASAIVLNGGKLAPRARLVIEAFRESWFYVKRAGLIAACDEVVHSKG